MNTTPSTLLIHSVIPLGLTFQNKVTVVHQMLTTDCHGIFISHVTQHESLMLPLQSDIYDSMISTVDYNCHATEF